MTDGHTQTLQLGSPAAAGKASAARVTPLGQTWDRPMGHAT